MASLIVLENGIETSRFELFGAITVGRMPEVCDLVSHDIAVSRRHCRIEPTPDGWLITDLDSRNGTRIGHHSITEEILKEGDRIVIGETVLLFTLANLPPKRPSHPEQALQLARAGRADENPNDRDHRQPRPLPRHWDESDASSSSGHSDTADLSPNWDDKPRRR